MKLKLVVSGSDQAARLAGALEGLGHGVSLSPDLPGLVEVDLLDPADASTVQRIAALVDHPSAAAVPA